MDNSTTGPGFDNLHYKLLELIENHKSLKEELVIIKEEKIQLRLVLDKQRETIKSFQSKPKFDTIVGSIATDADGAQAIRLRIDEFIKEIENCIAYLNE